MNQKNQVTRRYTTFYLSGILNLFEQIKGIEIEMYYNRCLRKCTIGNKSGRSILLLCAMYTFCTHILRDKHSQSSDTECVKTTCHTFVLNSYSGAHNVTDTAKNYVTSRKFFCLQRYLHLLMKDRPSSSDGGNKQGYGVWHLGRNMIMALRANRMAILILNTGYDRSVRLFPRQLD